MEIQKFGGTSMGNAQRIRDVARIVQDGEQKFVVLSAMAGITNLLYEAIDHKQKGVAGIAEEKLKELFTKLDTAWATLMGEHGTAFSDRFKEPVMHLLECADDELLANELVAYGEIMTTQLMYGYLKAAGARVMLVPALSYMWLAEHGDPDMASIRKNLEVTLRQNPDVDIYLTEGFICRTQSGRITNLKRGGSDYTATIIGAVLGARKIEIWSDVDGFHNNDPRFVNEAQPVRQLSYNEAAELAYFGAKIMHPTAVQPASRADIPLVLKNTLNPSDQGTVIHGTKRPDGIRAIAARDNIVVIRVTSGRMLNAFGFLRRLFAVFEDHRVPIDVITTSEVAVSVTIEAEYLEESLVVDLALLGEVALYKNQSVVCVVGNFSPDAEAVVASVLNALKHIPVRMISYGGSSINVTLVMNSEYKMQAMNDLHNQLLNTQNGKQKLVASV